MVRSLSPILLLFPQPAQKAVRQFQLLGIHPPQMLRHRLIPAPILLPAGAQQQLVRRNLQSLTDAHEYFQAWDRPASFNVGEVVIVDVASLTHLYLPQSHFFAAGRNALSELPVIHPHLITSRQVHFIYSSLP